MVKWANGRGRDLNLTRYETYMNDLSKFKSFIHSENLFNVDEEC